MQIEKLESLLAKKFQGKFVVNRKDLRKFYDQGFADGCKFERGENRKVALEEFDWLLAELEKEREK